MTPYEYLKEKTDKRVQNDNEEYTITYTDSTDSANLDDNKIQVDYVKNGTKITLKGTISQTGVINWDDEVVSGGSSNGGNTGENNGSGGNGNTTEGGNSSIEGIDFQVWQEEGTIKMSASGTEAINKITILRPDGVTYVKDFNQKKNVTYEYIAPVGGTYKIEAKGEKTVLEKEITLKEKEIIEGENYILIYGVEELKKFMTTVESGETTINAKLMNDINENLYHSRNIAYANLKLDGNKFTATSIDPMIYVDQNNASLNVSAVYIEFGEEITQDFWIDIYYEENGKFTESKKVRQFFPKGTKEGIINIPNGKYVVRVDIGDVKGISYRIKKISCITPELEENNWNKFIQTFKGKRGLALGNGGYVNVGL